MKEYLHQKVCSFCLKGFWKTTKKLVQSVSDETLLKNLNSAKSHDTFIDSGSLIHKKCISFAHRTNQKNSSCSVLEKPDNINAVNGDYF